MFEFSVAFNDYVMTDCNAVGQEGGVRVGAEVNVVSLSSFKLRKETDEIDLISTTSGRVLVVEDNSVNQMVLKTMLKKLGYDVVTADNGKKAVELLEKTAVDIILMDCHMPVMDGLTMLKKLRAESEWGKMVPVILLSNLSPDQDKINKSITEDEPAYYLVKTNWSMADVVEKVRERLDRKA